MSEVFLGIIALAVVVMAVIQVAGIVFAVSAARRIGETADRLERDIRPVVQNLQSITADAARAASLAAAQMDRADRLFGDLSRRAEQIMAVVPTILGPAGKGVAFMSGLKAVISIMRDLRHSSRRPSRPATAEDEDALFIG